MNLLHFSILSYEFAIEFIVFVNRSGLNAPNSDDKRNPPNCIILDIWVSGILY